MLKLGSVRWKGKCTKHPMYDPEADGLGGIRGGCRRCEMLLDIWTHHSKAIRLMREFGSREDAKIRPERSPDDGRQMSLLDATVCEVHPGPR